MEQIINIVTDREIQIAVLVSLASIVAAYTVLEPFFRTDKLCLLYTSDAADE